MKEFRVGDEVVAITTNLPFYTKGSEGVIIPSRGKYPGGIVDAYGLLYVKWLKGEFFTEGNKRHGSCWFVQPHEIQHKEKE